MNKVIFGYLLIGLFLASNVAFAQSSLEGSTRGYSRTKHSIAFSTLNYELVGFRYFYDFTPHWALGSGLGILPLYYSFNEVVSTPVVPIHGRYYFLTHKHRPFASLSSYFFPLYPGRQVSLGIGGGYEYRADNGFIARLGAEITTGPARIIPVINLGWSF